MQRNFKNVKTLKLDIKFKGNGCVNYDSTEQLNFLRNTTLIPKGRGQGFFNDKGEPLKNLLLSKKYIRTIAEDGKKVDEFLPKVSSECLRYYIFKEKMPYQNSSLQNIPAVLYSSVSTMEMILRGYFFPMLKSSLTKKGGLSIPDAISCGEYQRSVAMEICSRSGAKSTSDPDGQKDTSLYKKEVVGPCEYKTTGFIDLTELQFISNDPLYGRQAVKLDGGLEEQVYFEGLRRNMVNFEPKMGYYYINSGLTQDEWAEKGILLNRESVDAMVKLALKNILNIRVLKRDAFLETESLVITVNTGDGSSEPIEVTLDNVDDFYFDYYLKYEEASEEKILKNKELAEEFEKAVKEARASKNKSKKNKSEEGE